MTERVVGMLRGSDTLARLSGDEFVVLCEDLDAESHVEPLAGRIVAALGEPFVLSGGTVQITASVGVAVGGRDDELPEEVLRDADIAMYQAKRNGGACYGIIDRVL